MGANWALALLLATTRWLAPMSDVRCPMSDCRHCRMIFPPLKTGFALGLGGAPVGNLFAAISDDDAHAVLSQAIATGCSSFDSAPHYGNGLSEHCFGRALRGGGRDDGDTKPQTHQQFRLGP